VAGEEVAREEERAEPQERKVLEKIALESLRMRPVEKQKE
jgi:hypothetical protein